MFQGNGSFLRGTVTINHGTTLPGTVRTDFTAAFPGALVGDRVDASPIAVPTSSAVSVVASPSVTTAGFISVSLLNVGSASVAPGTAVQYDITVERQTGPASV